MNHSLSPSQTQCPCCATLLMLLSCKQQRVLESHFLLKSCLCFGICFKCPSLYIFSCLGCNLPDPWSHGPMLNLFGFIIVDEYSTFTLLMSYSHCRLWTSLIVFFQVFKDELKLSFLFFNQCFLIQRKPVVKFLISVSQCRLLPHSEGE